MDPGSNSPLPAFRQLERCPHCGNPLDARALELLTVIACPSCAAEIQIGTRIGPFQLLSVAGRGGMGVVYRALALDLNREIALKVLRWDQSGGSECTGKLAAEAAITAAINHPHVVRVFSTGIESGRFHLAMELIDKAPWMT